MDCPCLHNEWSLSLAQILQIMGLMKVASSYNEADFFQGRLFLRHQLLSSARMSIDTAPYRRIQVITLTLDRIQNLTYEEYC